MTMQQPASVVKRQTLKQAKADFKLRGRPTISERERRQIERAAELDKRACRIREQEKRRAEAVQKRAERVLKERGEKNKEPLGGERRLDRFGYQSSQFQLGAFFKRAGDLLPKRHYEEQPQEGEDVDHFGLEVDDAEMLTCLDTVPALKQAGREPLRRAVACSALPEPRSNEKDNKPAPRSTPPRPPPVAPISGPDTYFKKPALPLAKVSNLPTLVTLSNCRPPKSGPKTTYKIPHIPPPARKITSLQPPVPSMSRPPPPALPPVSDDDVGILWDQLDSSTQVARELNGPACKPHDKTGGSFSSDLDLSFEDLDALDRASATLSNRDHPVGPGAGSEQSAHRAVQTSHTHPYNLPRTSSSVTVDASDFTIMELESFVDDDLQLTQVKPG